MATVVLTVVGTLVGGPIGGAIGATVGQAIDRNILFKPKGRRGPRLTELSVQTSSYGRQIPRIFGTMRVAGTVIWAADLTEHRATQGGKGRPSTTTYSYSASFAVALSARAVLGIGRVWAEGTLLRGAAGDWKTATGFRLHTGGEDQPADPLIASAEGAGLAPAHRGIAYAVFEGLPLEEFGNRIPSLTFEVIADAAAPTIGAIAQEIGGGAVADGGAAEILDGYSAYGDSARGAIETLAELSGAWFAPAGERLEIRTIAPAATTVVDEGDAPNTRARRIAPIETVPRTIALAHYDPARDHQIGIQRAVRPGAGARTENVEAPAAMASGAAKTLAEALLARAEAGRVRRRVTTGSAALAIVPGDAVTIDGESGTWRVTEAAFEGMAVMLDLMPLPGGVTSRTASGGRVLAAPDRIEGATILHVFETPPLDGVLLTKPRVTIVAAGTAPGWRRAALLTSVDDGISWQPAGGTGAPAVIGAVTVPPGAGPATLVDRINSIEVELAHDDMALASADAAAIDRGANLAMVGEELLQFAEAVPLGARRWRLAGLWRARRGLSGTHHPGERFVVIEAASALTLDIAAAPGAGVRVLASGPGDVDTPVEAGTILTGASMLPPAPVRLVAEELADGGVQLRWRRRARTGGAWRDGGDVPLGEEREAYRVTIGGAGGGERSIETAMPTIALTAADRIGGTTTIAVRQLGTNGASPPATITI